MNKYLIALDLDDTLLNHQKEVTEKTKKCLKKLYNQGHVIAIISGRIFDTCYEIVSKLDFINYMVTDSGSLIFDNIKKEVIYKKKLSKDNIKKILNLYNDKMEYIEFSDEHYYYKYSTIPFKHYGLSKDIVDIRMFIRDNNAIHSSIRMLDYHENEKIIKIINEVCPTINVFEMKNSDMEVKWLELVQKGVSKYNSIKYLCKRENIRWNNTISFGDNYNDIDMIKNTKFGVAMGNAIDEVKKIATFITKSCDEDGIEYYLRGIFDINEGVYRK